MKMVPKSRKVSFGQPGNSNGIRQNKNIADGKQSSVGVTKNPGSKSSGSRARIKTV